MTSETRQTILHVTQNEKGQWSLAAEGRDGGLKLLSFGASSREHLIEEAHDLIKNRVYRNAVVKAEEPRPLHATPSSADAPLPRRVGEVAAAGPTVQASLPAQPTPPTPNVPSKWVYWTSDGGGAAGDGIVRNLYKWLYQQKQDGLADLIVYGGDIYWDGTDDDFNMFYQQIGNGDDSRANEILQIMCATSGNHDWHTLAWDSGDPKFRSYYPPYPSGYDKFWNNAKESCGSMQHIDDSKYGGARYEHYIDLNGWRLIFLDTGALDSGVDYSLLNVWNTNPWPMGDLNRYNQLDGWLDHTPNETTRANMVFAHHSRLSCGCVGDNYGLDAMWQLLFDEMGQPRAIFTLSGHDHNVSVYDPVDSGLSPVDNDWDGVQVIVNGAGGESLMTYTKGTLPTAFPPGVTRNPDFANYPDYDSAYNYGYCITQIELTGHDPGDGGNIVPIQAIVTILDFGSDGVNTSPKVLWGPTTYDMFPNPS